MFGLGSVDTGTPVNERKDACMRLCVCMPALVCACVCVFLCLCRPVHVHL